MAAEVELPDAPLLTTITLEAPADPDYQATVNDFLDYTEYYPSDCIRSNTLIDKLHENYKDAAARVHDLTTTYGLLPTIPANERPDPQELRADISEALEQAISFREAAYAEACRLAAVTTRAHDRLPSIIKKLKALPEPPSRDPTPAPPSPQTTRSRKPPNELERVQRITIVVDKDKKSTGARVPRHRQILIPGDVLPPPGPNDDIYTESEEEQAVDSVDEQGEDGTRHGGGRLKTPKPPKLKIAKPPRPRAQGVMGTNVHSSVAGISTSNALAMLTPPPQDAKPGSIHKPWFKLTEFEMAKLRKSMKKNAIWTPSDTMIRRQLADTGRGRDNYEKARAHSETTGEAFIDEDPVEPGKTILAPGEVSWMPTGGKAEAELINRGMRLNEAKRNKKEQAAKAAKEAELEEANKKIEGMRDTFKNLFNSNKSTPILTGLLPLPGSSTMKKDSRASKKRKRDSEKDLAAAETPPAASDAKEIATPGPKKLKITNSNIAIAPKPSHKAKPPPIKTVTTTTSVPLAPAGPSPKSATTRKVRASALTEISPTDTKKSPIPTPTTAQPTAAQSRSRRASIPSKIMDTMEVTPSGIKRDYEPTRDMRPRSRGNVISGKAASAEPPASKRTSDVTRSLREKGRRASVVDAHPASEPSSHAVLEPRTTRGGRRPAPGLVTADENGKGKVSVGKRKAAPKKKGVASTNPAQKKEDAPADEGVDEFVDPDEPRYCLCGDVSFGTMIACENEECEKEWFHLGCVGLTEIPPRRTKWYCPDCRDALGIDQKGNAATLNDGAGRRR